MIKTSFTNTGHLREKYKVFRKYTRCLEEPEKTVTLHSPLFKFLQTEAKFL